MRLSVPTICALLAAFAFVSLPAVAQTKLTPDQHAMREKFVVKMTVQCSAGKVDDQVSCDAMFFTAVDILLLDGRFDKTKPEVDQGLVEVDRLCAAAGQGDAAKKVRARLAGMQCPAMQSEAKGNLKALYVAEESFRGENDTYSKDFKALGYEPKGKLRYKYMVTVATKTKFAAIAIGEGDADGDVWEISDKNDLKNTSNMCDKK